MELADDPWRRVVVLGHLDLPDDALAVVGVHLVERGEGELVKVEHLADVGPVLEALDPPALDQVRQADDHRSVLLEDHVPEVHDGVAFRPLRRYVQVLAGEALQTLNRIKIDSIFHPNLRNWFSNIYCPGLNLTIQTGNVIKEDIFCLRPLASRRPSSRFVSLPNFKSVLYLPRQTLAGEVMTLVHY